MQHPEVPTSRLQSLSIGDTDITDHIVTAKLVTEDEELPVVIHEWQGQEERAQ